MEQEKNLIKKPMRKWGQVTTFITALLLIFNFSFIRVSAEEFNDGAIIQQTYKQVHKLERVKSPNSVDEDNSQIKSAGEGNRSLDKDNYELEEVKYILSNYYLNDVADKVQKASSVDELIKSLEDPYTSYFTKEEYDNFINGIEKKFYGIGIYMDMVEEGLKVVSTVENSPAQEVGLKAGDIIVKIGDLIVKGKTQEEIASSLRGEAGTTVILEVRRESQILNLKVTRKAISTPTVLGNVLKGNIGYVRIASFGENTGKEFKNVFDDLESKNIKSYIVDLRFNGGGYITSALDIGGCFVGENPVVLMKNKQGVVDSHNGYKQDKIIQRPVIFLVNEYSASASEILSAAVKDYGKAFFMGKTTFGKGVAQSMIPLSSGGVLKFTTHEFFSPKGNKIHHKGITPDFEVDNEEDVLDTARLLLADSNGEKISKIKSKKLNEIIKKTGDKVIKVKFNKELDVNTVKEQNIELVAQGSAENIPMSFEVDKSDIVVTSSKVFEKGKNYYLLVNDKIKSKDGKSLIAGEVVKIVVNQ
ncbi:S41 family peptidase [Clostridium sp. MB40-C1]|uniref:S41 family peptidase n=1 Tax=Clostridium sp. MB40-C1 TaxID=3070996 RepID=UPI0027E0E5D4|nr:S41 family peptidase [Clostridium sp. MB40-C1]WMJ80791.1 S41 family peptidase [Clostridium sp. MB40-C1]